MQDFFKTYQGLFNEHLNNFKINESPKNLYDPIRYLINIKGKQIRPVLTLLAADTFGLNPKQALDAALSVEIFHNFTLVHDDIMDDASLRRGHTTVHNKWDLNTAILSGDAMLIQAYRVLQNYPDPLFKKLFQLLNKTAGDVCEGQQYDLDFEKNNQLNFDDYIDMIRLKTAILLGCSLKMGAIIGGANKVDCKLINDFGIDMGIAFQLQDDYLDSFGDSKIFGKKIGGDIMKNKKTILYHLVLKNGKLDHQKKIKKIMEAVGESNNFEDKIFEANKIYVESGSKKSTREMINFYSERARKKIELLTINQEKKKIFIDLIELLMNREK
ncbi:MAG: polyprenyl synthetase family protein [Bacteroidota bacterium]|nr:polyprenyl synthetase family protein [Bacteroidota bacterium]